MKSGKKRFAVVLSLVLVLSAIIPSNLLPVQAGEYARLTVQFEESYDSATGTVEYRNTENEWIVVEQSVSEVNATAVRIVTSEEYSVANHSSFRIDGADILRDEEVQAAIFTEEGYPLINDGNYQFEHLEFLRQNGEPGGEPGDEPGDGPAGFSGSVYFVWKGAEDALCIHEIKEVECSPERVDINYVGLSTIRDDETGEQFQIDNEAYFFVWENKIDSVKNYASWGAFESAVEEDEGFKREVAIDPCGAVNGNSTVCTNGNREFRITIYAEDSYEGIVFSDDINDYTYFPDFWDNMFFSSTVDISGSTADNPAVYETFILEPSIHFEAAENGIAEFTSVKALDVPKGAVDITDNGDGSFDVVFHSNYYDKVVFEITTTEDTYYVMIARIAMKAADNFGPDMTEAAAINGTLYYGENDSYENYQVAATICYKDGSEKFAMAELSEEFPTDVESGKGLKCATYQVVIGADLQDASDVEGVAFTVIKSGTSDSDYAGTYCGSGTGVYYDIDSRTIRY